MRSHGGLFKLSLDRIQNTHSGGEYYIHYPDPDNAMVNIRLVPFAINLSNCGAFTLDVVQEAVRQRVDLASLLNYESQATRKPYGSTTLYACCNGIFQKMKKLETFLEVGA